MQDLANRNLTPGFHASLREALLVHHMRAPSCSECKASYTSQADCHCPTADAEYGKEKLMPLFFGHASGVCTQQPYLELLLMHMQCLLEQQGIARASGVFA